MKKIILFLIFPSLIYAQSIYNPQDLYDTQGGFFDEDSLRSIYLDFYMPDYHSYLVNSWYYSPSERIPAEIIFKWNFI